MPHSNHAIKVTKDAAPSHIMTFFVTQRIMRIIFNPFATYEEVDHMRIKFLIVSHQLKEEFLYQFSPAKNPMML